MGDLLRTEVAALNPKLVLLVEDEVDARDVLLRALVRAGYQGRSAGTRAEAQAQIHALPLLDAAVVDVKLGAEDEAGLELIAPLRAAFPGLRVVVITAFADFDKVKRALNAGASYLLEKPFASAELVAVLARLFAERDDSSARVDAALARARLTEKETEVARLVLKGLPSLEIAKLISISEKTVRQHLSQVFAKCGVASRAELFHHVFPS